MKLFVVKGISDEEFKRNISLIQKTENVIICSEVFFEIDYIDTESGEKLSGAEALVKLIKDTLSD